LQLLDAKCKTLTRVSIVAVRKAQRSILRNKISARANDGAPPFIANRAGPKHPNITLPYNNVVTAKAYTSYTRTLLLKSPSNLEWHLILLNAALALHILLSNMAVGLLFALLIISPKYLNSCTFLIGRALHTNLMSILIYIAYVLSTFIYSPFILQNISKAVSKCYSPSALCDNNTASSAKARKKICKVAISNINRLFYSILCFSRYYNKNGYTWSKKILNSFGEAQSPYLTPVFASNLSSTCPSIFIIPLLLMYMFLIIYIRHCGIYNLFFRSSHNAVRSTRS
jgi:hypothetical protein